MLSGSNDMMRRAWLLLPLALSACTATSPPPPAPPPQPAAPVAMSEPVHSGDWRDWPLTPGRWRYVAGTPVSSARYGDPAAARFVVQCDVVSRRVTIMRAGTASEIAITTSSRTARFPAGPIDERGTAMSGVVLNATDAFLDAMAFSRGRIAVASPGLSTLVIPTWAEPARAIEDCRK